jgi:hypothetical protein
MDQEDPCLQDCNSQVRLCEHLNRLKNNFTKKTNKPEDGWQIGLVSASAIKRIKSVKGPVAFTIHFARTFKKLRL